MCACESRTTSIGGRSRTRTPGRRCRRNRISQVEKTGSKSRFWPAACTKNDEWPIKVIPSSSRLANWGLWCVPRIGVTADRQSRCPVYRSRRLISAQRPTRLRFPISLFFDDNPPHRDLVFTLAGCFNGRTPLGALRLAALPHGSRVPFDVRTYRLDDAILTPPAPAESRTFGAVGVND